MEYKELQPNQIIALFDDPIRYELILKIYFKIFQKGANKIISPCPVIHKSTGIPFIDGNQKEAKRYNDLLIKFLKTHPEAEYFLLDGTHKTTAATLAHELIPVIIFKSDKDIKDARKLTEAGEIINLTISDTITKNLKELSRYFSKTKVLQTVVEKTEKMVRTHKLPKYMIRFYKKRKLTA